MSGVIVVLVSPLGRDAPPHATVALAAWNIGDWARGGKGPGGLWTASVDRGYAQHSDIVGWCGHAVVMIGALVVLTASRHQP